MNQIPHFDGGFVLLHENEGTASPIGVVYYEYYSEIKVLEQKLKSGSDLIQCVVGPHFKNAIPYGKSQEPELWDYADNVDTMQFLIQL